MSVEISILPDAIRELDDQADYYLGKQTRETAEKWLDCTEETFQFLAKNPEIGKLWESPHRRLSGVRTWPVNGFETFIVFYRSRSEGIEVLHVLLGSRNLDHVL